jgi:imidazoleglycerol-phosphate dehydratase / histidinol-phosphatase
MKKILFIDRDGTIIDEPQPDQQVDSLEKLSFLPGAIFTLARLARETDFEFVLVTNQDGLGTASFPEETFWPAHQKMLQTLAGEGVHFSSEHIDRSFPHEGLPTRKPGTAMLGQYLSGGIDLANSYVIGDRLTDVELAKNLGAQAILIQTNPGASLDAKSILASAVTAVDWEGIYAQLRLQPRQAELRRTTRETDILASLNLDGTGAADIRTGLHFFDHMLDQVARHARIDLTIKAQGDLQVDEHHTIEDTALALGELFVRALGDKRGLSRYGFCLPMDDALAQVAIDFGGRPWLVWKTSFKREKIGDMPTEMFEHFFKSFSDTARCNLNIQATGRNEHHKIEAIFKAFARAIQMAIKRDGKHNDLPTTKGIL